MESHYFIDLYFPGLNLGIECDELYHSKEEQITKDKLRDISIYDILHKIDRKGYESIHIDISGNFEELENKIEKAVFRIKEKIKEIKPVPWDIQSPRDYFKNKDFISIKDKKSFSTINKICNVLFNARRQEDSKGAMRSYFSLPTFKGTELENYKLWFPKLAIEILDKH